MTEFYKSKAALKNTHRLRFEWLGLSSKANQGIQPVLDGPPTLVCPHEFFEILKPKIRIKMKEI